MLRAPYKARVTRIQELLPDALDDEPLVNECAAKWAATLDLAHHRNALVHNPIVFGWHDKSESGPPDIIGIPDVSHLGPKPPITQKIGTLADINALVNQAVQLAVALYALLARCDAALAGPAGDESSTVA